MGLWDLRNRQGPSRHPPLALFFFGFSPRFFSRSRERGEMVCCSPRQERDKSIAKNVIGKYMQENFQPLKNNNTFAIGLGIFRNHQGSSADRHLPFPAISIGKIWDLLKLSRGVIARNPEMLPNRNDFRDRHDAQPSEATRASSYPIRRKSRLLSKKVSPDGRSRFLYSL